MHHFEKEKEKGKRGQESRASVRPSGALAAHPALLYSVNLFLYVRSSREGRTQRGAGLLYCPEEGEGEKRSEAHELAASRILLFRNCTISLVRLNPEEGKRRKEFYARGHRGNFVLRVHKVAEGERRGKINEYDNGRPAAFPDKARREGEEKEEKVPQVPSAMTER